MKTTRVSLWLNPVFQTPLCPMPPPATRQAKPLHQQADLPEFWDHRFQAGATPWDLGGVPRQLQEFAENHPVANPRVLIPGCGSAHDAGWLDRQGWQVTALDFSPAAIRLAGEMLGNWQGTLLEADFFRHPFPESFDLIYERAFLCALPRRLWPDYGPRMATLVKPGGLLVGYFFFSPEPKGPPFGAAPGELALLLEPVFELLEDHPVSDSLPMFAGQERWQVWRRR